MNEDSIKKEMLKRLNKLTTDPRFSQGTGEWMVFLTSQEIALIRIALDGLPAKPPNYFAWFVEENDIRGVLAHFWKSGRPIPHEGDLSPLAQDVYDALVEACEAKGDGEETMV